MLAGAAGPVIVSEVVSHYLRGHREHRHRRCRFDVVTVTGSGEASDIKWIRECDAVIAQREGAER